MLISQLQRRFGTTLPVFIVAEVLALFLPYTVISSPWASLMNSPCSNGLLLFMILHTTLEVPISRSMTSTSSLPWHRDFQRNMNLLLSPLMQPLLIKSMLNLSSPIFSMKNSAKPLIKKLPACLLFKWLLAGAPGLPETLASQDAKQDPFQVTTVHPVTFIVTTVVEKVNCPVIAPLQSKRVVRPT